MADTWRTICDFLLVLRKTQFRNIWASPNPHPAYWVSLCLQSLGHLVALQDERQPRTRALGNLSSYWHSRMIGETSPLESLGVLSSSCRQLIFLQRSLHGRFLTLVVYIMAVPHVAAAARKFSLGRAFSSRVTPSIVLCSGCYLQVVG